ncbi:Ty3-gypsy retrotransposon protein [Burkholderia sp. IT-111MI5]
MLGKEYPEESPPKSAKVAEDIAMMEMISLMREEVLLNMYMVSTY